MEKMTKREFFTALINFANTDVFEYETANGDKVTLDKATIKTFSENEILLLDKKAAKAKERNAAKKAEGDELVELIYAAMSSEDFETKEEILAKMDVSEDVTVSKVSYRLGVLVNEGKAEKTEVTRPAEVEGGKKRKLMGYRKLA